MGQVIRAQSLGSGIDSIDHDHEHLQILITLAERSAINGDRKHCRQMLQRAIGFLEEHAGTEEHLLTRSGYSGVLDVRRGHERLIVSLEQALAGVESRERGALIDELRRISDFMTDRAGRDGHSLRRFLAQASYRPHAVAIAATA